MVCVMYTIVVVVVVITILRKSVVCRVMDEKMIEMHSAIYVFVSHYNIQHSAAGLCFRQMFSNLYSKTIT